MAKGYLTYAYTLYGLYLPGENIYSYITTYNRLNIVKYYKYVVNE